MTDPTPTRRRHPYIDDITWQRLAKIATKRGMTRVLRGQEEPNISQAIRALAKEEEDRTDGKRGK